MLFYQVGEFFQSLAVKRSRKSISDLMDIRPDSATVRRNGELVVVAPETVSIGEMCIRDSPHGDHEFFYTCFHLTLNNKPARYSLLRYSEKFATMSL